MHQQHASVLLVHISRPRASMSAVAEDRLSDAELAQVLSRAGELDASLERAEDGGVSLAAVEAAAAEVGLSPAAVHQAVAELRAGLLAEETAAPTSPAWVVEASVLPMDPDAALAAVGKWLSDQTFHRHRGRGGAEVWRPREDWIAGFQRSFDWSASVRLKGVAEVVVRAIPVDGGTLVRLEARLRSAATHAAGIGGGVGAAAGVNVATTGMVMQSPGLAALGAGLTGAAGIGGWLAGRGYRLAKRDKVGDELGAALDRMATGDEATPTAIARLRAKTARHRSRWV